jgi:hypothetical protein
MKDFHDLYSLILLGVLDKSLTAKAIQLVFHHRQTSLKKLPIKFDKDTYEAFERNWNLYRRKLKIRKDSPQLPNSIEELIFILNQWLNEKIFL